MGYANLTAEELAEIVKDLTVDDIERAIADTPDAEREAFKAQVREAETSQGDPRQGVLDATEHDPDAPTAPLPGGALHPDPDPEEQVELQDTSGRPPLAEVAQQRAENVIERRLPADEPTGEEE